MKLKIFLVIITILFTTKQTFSQTSVVVYNFTGGPQNFVVPPCVNTITVNVRGGQGGGSNGGNGASVTSTLAVTSGQTLQVNVGAAGNCPIGGYNGGGPGASGSSGSCGGGGLSSIGSLIVAAGGGGRGGGTVSATGGVGGCTTGGAGGTIFGVGGGGGTQLVGGTGGLAWGSGNNGGVGSFNLGGAGAIDPCFGTGPGGGGGGGFYGGGGGGSDCFAGGTGGGGGGGGGSSFVPLGGSCAAGVNTGNGVVSITVTLLPPPVITVNSATICNGSTTTLTASGGTSYTWQPGNLTGSSVIVAPLSTTVYTITGMSGSCTGTTTATVTVNSTVSAGASSSTICAGSSATLTGFGATSYTWNPGSIVSNSTIVSPVISTIYTLTGTSGTCISTTIVPITVLPPPTINAFNLSGTICAGSSANAIGTGALTYTWNPGSIVGNIVSLSPIVTTTYIITGAVGACSNTTSLVIPVSNGPTLTVVGTPTLTCPGDNATLTATGALSYTWNPGGIISNSLIISPLITTNYTVTGVNAFGCTSTATINQNVNPIPILTITPASSSICVGFATTLTASGASSYTWNPGGLTTPIIVISPTTTTNYSIVGSNGTCTNSTTALLTVVPIPTVSAFSSTTNICSGSAVTLTASGATSYTWNPGGLIGSPVSDSPLVNTTYTVIGSSSTCTNSAVISVTVNNGPNMISSVSPTNVCAGNSATLTSSGALTYTWNPGALLGGTVTVTPAATTLYSVTGNNIFGCTTTQTVNLNVTPNPTVTASASSASICIGSNATLTASGATSYTWNPGGFSGSSIIVSPTANSTYTLEGVNSGCNGQTTIAINVVPIPTVNAVSSATAICNGSSATLTASGAITYTWNPGALIGSTVSVSPSTTTVYTVTGSNGSCIATTTVNLIVNPTPTITASASPTIICIGNNATLTSTGALTYTWMPGILSGATVTVAPTLTTVYIVSGTNVFGCTATNAAILVVTPIPTIAVNATSNSICSGASTTLSVNGASSYTWNPGSLSGSSVTVSPNTNTTYTVIGSNGGCSTSATLSIIVNPSPTISALVSPTIICAGSSATLSAAGAATYTWNPGALNGANVTVTPPATTLYSVTGANGFGCTASNTVNLVVSPIPTVNAIASSGTICIGNSSTLTASGASSYTWNPGALIGNTVAVAPVVNTTYTLLGSNGTCLGTQTVNVIVNPLPTINIVATPTAICSGASFTLNATGASTYTWNPGSLSGALVIVSPTTTTTYTIDGTSSLGCINSATINLIVNPVPTLTIAATPTAICSGNSATLSGIATGGGPFVSIWNPGAIAGNTAVVSPTSSTTYSWNVINSFACSTTATVSINVTASPTLSASASNGTICAGNSSTLTAAGATSYTWHPGSLTGAVVVVSPTVNTTYTVDGANGSCINSQTIDIVVNPTPTIITSASPTIICAGGSATLSASGAATYTWNPGALNGANVTVAPPATALYSVTGANGFGCTASNTVNLVVSPIPTVNAIASLGTICLGNSSTLTASGASSYTWNPGALIGNTVAVAPVVNTTYTLLGSNGTCLGTQTVNVIVNPLPTINIVATPTAICSGASSTLSATGASTYTWNPGSLSGALVIVSPTTTTTYTIDGTSSLGCINSATINLIVNPVPTLTIAVTPTAICSGNSATLSGIATGGGPFVSIWNPGAIAGNTAVVSPTSSTTYSWNVINSFACSTTATVSINVTASPTLSASASNGTICAGNSSTLTAAGATSYTWHPGSLTGAVVVVSPTVNTTYTVDGANGSCVNSQTIVIAVDPTPTIITVVSPTSICAGSSATLSASGAATYTWNPGILIASSVTVAPSATTLYSVTGASGFGCATTNTVNITVSPIPTVAINVPLVPICAGQNATLVGSGALSYTWLPGGSNATVLVVPLPLVSTFTLIGSNGNCESTQTITLIPSANPTISVSASSSTICAGNSVTLTSFGATTYSWIPINSTGSLVVTSPTTTTTYTVIGVGGFGCTGQTTINVNVSPIPTLAVVPSATSICVGSNVTFTASGSGTYTWNPTGLTTATITDTPTLTTTYSVSTDNISGCVGTSTIMIVVNAVPSITISPNSATVCSSSTITLSASGASSYTWFPSSNTGSTSIETPTVNTTYTVVGANGICSSIYTVDVFVNPLPSNVTATSSGSITCTANTVTLTGSSTSSNISYFWAGPFSYTSSIQNPTVSVQGAYTLNVADNVTGCSVTASLNVPTDSSIPSLTATTSGSITCANATVTLNAISSSTNVNYTWVGPSNFTSTAQTFTLNQAGSYTINVTDLSSACSNFSVVTVTIHTNVAVSASIAPSTCSGSLTNNDGTISLFNFSGSDKYDYVAGTTYTGTAVYLSATTIPTNGIVANTLANPTATLPYTIRLFDANGCIKDTVLVLSPVNCLSNKSIGIAKSVSAATLNANGSYDVNYKIVIKNYGLLPLNDVTLVDNLNNTFPSPATYSITSAPIATSIGSSLVINPLFDGNLQTSITTSLSSILNVSQTDTIVFGVRVFTNGFFGPFNNSVIGYASPSPSVSVIDTSNVGIDADPDNDNDPTNNSVSTPITFTPNLFFGLTKTATLSNKLSDKTYDITYVITVHNLGNDTLRNITVKDSLFEKTIKTPASYFVKSGPTVTGGLSANSSFNGNSDINLLMPGSSIMPPGGLNTIVFTINVAPDTVTVIKNSAFGNAISSGSVTVSDTSNAGINPDVNNNGIWNEPADNVPTVVMIPNSDFFIPEGFSPNGDGKNDVFVIKGLPVDVDNVLTIYNRWGNKVYTKTNYDNTWNGTPNVNGTLGTEKLSPGTYYYIIEFKGGEIKNTNGFIILQY